MNLVSSLIIIANSVSSFTYSVDHKTFEILELKKLIQLTKNNYDRCAINNLLSNSQRTGHVARAYQAIKYGKTALKLARKLNLPNQERFALANIAWGYRRIKNVEHAFLLAKRSLTIARQLDDPTAILDSLDVLSTVYSAQGDFNGCIKVYNQAIKIYQSVGDDYKVIEQLHMIGTVLRQKGEFEEAHKYYNDAINGYLLHGDFGSVLQLYHYIIQDLFSSDHLDEYYKAIDKMKSFYAEHIDKIPPKHKTRYFLTMIDYERRKKNYEEAFKWCQKLLDTAGTRGIEMGPDRYYEWAYTRFAEIYTAMKEYNKSAIFYKKAIDVFPSSDNMELKYRLGQVLYWKGDYHTAIKVFGEISAKTKGVDSQFMDYFYSSFFLGLSYHCLEKHSKTISLFETCLDSMNKAKDRFNNDDLKFLYKTINDLLFNSYQAVGKTRMAQKYFIKRELQ
ncbi:MAG: tetratricopeptide repeat protein [Bacteroidales bacterium]|nr:tetratricopeptide repeat protein [Bacteroidales bacterium]